MPPPLFCITGNIGSGKTTVCREFTRLGIPVYYTDTAAKRLMTEDPALKAALQACFGAATYHPDGRLNRPWLATRAFRDPQQLAKLNALVHPAVHQDAAAWRKRQTAPYCLYETALAFETGAQDRFAAIIVVAAPLAVRRARVLRRDQTTPAAFADRAARQWSDEQKETAADYLIYNDGQQLLFPQVLALHRQLLAFSGK